MDSAFFEFIKRLMGVVWIALGLYLAYDRVNDSLVKISSVTLSDNIFGWVMLCVLTPIVAFSLVAFGYLSIMGDYAKD